MTLKDRKRTLIDRAFAVGLVCRTNQFSYFRFWKRPEDLNVVLDWYEGGELTTQKGLVAAEAWLEGYIRGAEK